VSGERRYQAALRGGLATVPVLITDGDPVEIAIVENLLRESLTAIEEAEAIDRLRSEHNYTLTDLPEILGKAESTLSEILALNKLPETVKNDCRNDPKAARRILTEIAKCGSPRRMTSLYEKYKAKGLTRGELRSKAKGPQEKPATAKLCLVRNFLKRLEALETAGLEESQLHQLAKELEQLRLVAQAKLEALRPQAQG
jgi:ParB family chromosome partitioning protein